MAELISSQGLDSNVERYFITFYEYGFTNFAENSKILSKTAYILDHAMELVLNKDFYVK